jgi:type IV secretory pathway VirB4 component
MAIEPVTNGKGKTRDALVSSSKKGRAVVTRKLLASREVEVGHGGGAGGQVFFMDKGYSAFVLTRALGGDHLDLGEEEVPLQPLARIDEPADRMKRQVLLEDC